MRQNPGSGGLLQLGMLGAGAWFLFRTPPGGGPTLFAQLTGGAAGSLTPSTAALPGQLTIAAGTPLPAGYRLVRVTAAGQQVIAPAPPGTVGYVPAVYSAVGTAASVVGTAAAAVGVGNTLIAAFQRLFSPSPASAAPLAMPPALLNPYEPVLGEEFSTSPPSGGAGAVPGAEPGTLSTVPVDILTSPDAGLPTDLWAAEPAVYYLDPRESYFDVWAPSPASYEDAGVSEPMTDIWT